MPRPKTLGELQQVRQEVLFKPSESVQLDEFLKTKGARLGLRVKRATFIHDLTMRALADEIDAATPPAAGMETPARAEISFPVIGSAVCGPWADAVADTHEVLLLSEHMANLLEARDDDVFIRAHGESMERAGIIDGAFVLLRPLAPSARPRSGEIALVQILTRDGDCRSTLKYWHETGAGPHLTDGDGNSYPLPADTERLIPVAVARGLVSRL
ncbi:MAG: hypothetical protein JO316_14075 [Abitibacteriaceae bacterium]|nr:hypothetical protein [Abditibacteriaceae bacterium]